MILEILLSFLAGVLTLLAPCILLPLPIILSASIGQKSRLRPFFIALGFIVTFSIVALSLNWLITAFNLDPNLIRNIGTLMLLVFAVFMIWPKPFELMALRFSKVTTTAAQIGQGAGNGNFGGFIMGIVIGAVWAPCAGPILASILTLISLDSDKVRAAFLLVSYSIGAGIPMLLIAYGSQKITTKIKTIAKYSTRITQAFGVVLIFVAGAIYFQYDTSLTAWLIQRIPLPQNTFEQTLFEKISPDSETALEEKQAQEEESGELDNYGKAPEFTGITKWLNSEPLTIESLKGKVVLVDFWTYSCINCIRTFPYVTKWYDTYKDQGFVVVGVHSPEFAFEKVTANVETAIKRQKITYPVAQDNDFGTWRAYSNKYWPAHYLIDKEGNVVYVHFGEGGYDLMENNIRKLLDLDAGTVTKEEKPNATSPEMYFGTDRIANFAQGAPSSEAKTYVIPNRLDLNKFALEGEWKFNNESAELVKGPGKIKLNFNAGKAFIVMESKTVQSIVVKVDNLPPRIIQIGESDLYNLFDSEDYKSHVLEITIPDAGFNAFTFTFG